MAKTPTFVLMFAVCLLLDVKYLTLASNTTAPESKTSYPIAATLGQETTADTLHHGSSTAGATAELPGNTDTNETSNAVNTTLTTMSQGSVGSLSTALPTKNGIDSMTRDVTETTPGGGTRGAPPLKTTLMNTPGTTAKASKDNKVRNGIIILVVVVGVIVVSLLFCFFQRRKKERNSFNLYSASPDNAEIPLSSGVAEKNAAQNMKEDKIDIHPIEPPENTSEKGDSPKQGAASDPADGHEGESNSTASTVPKDEEADKLSLDSSQASLLPPGTGNLKAEDGNAATPTEMLNENNNNSSQWAILQLKRGGRADELYPTPPASSVTTRNHGECLSEMERATLMQADFEEDQGRCAGDFAHKSSFHDILVNPEP